MPSFLLELYLPRTSSVPQASETARFVAAEAARSGLAVRYVRTLFIAEDETCFHVFEAPSRETLVEALHRAGLEQARITEAIQSEAAAGE